jgi:NADPH:quinone reductase-like Zn-dependent oxidoreductase
VWPRRAGADDGDVSFSLPVETFPLAEVAEAHRMSEQGRVRGKLVLLVG